jgi:superfamily II DNA or RNA helicase
MIKDLIKISNSDKSLRPYQASSKKEIYEAWLSVRSVLFQMPTGTGKTRLFASIIKDVRTISVEKAIIPQPRILVLAHRTELIEQISNTITNKYHISCGIIKSGIWENMDALVQVASVQSLTRRLARWGTIPFGLIVIDEAHHALAKTYLKICSAFPDARILGVTATPYRLNGESFRKIFDKLIVSPTVQKFIDMGYLSKFQYYSIKPTAQIQYDINNIHYFGANGDYVERELMNICDKTQVRAQLIKSYTKFAMGKKGIVYTINKTHNKHVAQQYRGIGVSVATIDSDTPAEERRRIVFDFKNGKYDIICNVNIFSEGFDCPDIEFIQLARPTLSLSLYLQQVGRALRISNNKTYALILDNVGSYNKFGLPNKPIDWNRYFNGIGGIIPAMHLKQSAILSKEQNNISEADEDMMLISESEGIAINIKSSSYSIFDIIATKKQFPIGLRGYVHRAEFEAAKSNGKEKLVDLYQSIHNIACSYSKLETYIDDSYSVADNFDEDEIVQNMLEDTYLFNVNGKYGICRLKLGRDIKELLNENASSSFVNVSDYFNVLLEPEYDRIDTPNSLDCFVTVKNGVYGVINGTTLKDVIPFEYDEINEVGVFTNYIVRKGGKEGVLDARGKEIIPLKWDVIYRNYNDSFTFEDNGEYYVLHGGTYIPKLDIKVEQLTDDMCIYCHHNNKNVLFITNNSGKIVFPLGAETIFLTNIENEICLEYLNSHILLNADLSLKSDFIEGKHPERESIFKAQRARRKKEKQKEQEEKQRLAKQTQIATKEEVHKIEQPIQKKKRPRIIRNVNLEK